MTLGIPRLSDTCNRGHCQEPAHWQVGFRVWAKGYPKDSHAPMEAYLGIVVCFQHGPLTTTEHVLSVEGKAQIEHVIAARGGAPPDWDSAEVVLIPLAEAKTP